MKSKVLSLVLALTVLCSILSVSTVSYAAVDKGEEILFKGNEVLQNPKGYTTVAAGNISFAAYGRDGVTGPIIQVSNTTAIVGSNGEFAHFPITHNFDLNSPYTFEFEYYAKNKVNVALALGDVDIFVHFGGSGNVALTNGTALGIVENATLTTLEWHKVAFTYNGTQYSLYVDEKLIGTFDAFKSDITGTETMKIGVYNGTIKENDNLAIVAVDEIYAYQSAYEPEQEEPVTVSEITIIHDEPNLSRSAKVTLTEEYVGCKLWIAFYGAGNELIGVTFKQIEEAGENIVTSDQSEVLNTTAEGVEEREYGLTRSLAAFVWDANNRPTGIIKTIGRP
ncbi:MAG: hypothetical protein II998_05310 [Clostridia bacterium]|nr:hypothetical protein [Clostridia bacterium]